MRFVLLIYLLLTSSISANYYDSDIDGVEDRLDQCNDTPFDVLVDEFGCNKNSTNIKFTLTLGTDVGFDTLDSRDTTYNFAFDYKINHWRMGISNSNYIGYNDNNSTSRELGDIYTYIGYEVAKDKYTSIVTLGTKLAMAKDTIGTGKNDYYMSTQLETYSSNNAAKLFGVLSYTVTGDTNSSKYEDIFSGSIGIGYTVSDKYYTSVSYENSESIYRNTENFQAIVWTNYYIWKENSFVEIDYMCGLDTLSYKHMISFKFGVTFE